MVLVKNYMESNIMILDVNSLKISKDFKKKEPSIILTKEDIAKLNDKIKQDIKQNEKENLASNATFPRNKGRGL